MNDEECKRETRPKVVCKYKSNRSSMHLRVLFCLLTISIFLNKIAFAEQPVNILQIACNGEVSILKNGKSVTIPKKTQLGDVHSGMLFKGNFYAVNIISNEIVATNLNSGEKKSVINLNDFMDGAFNVHSINYVDDEEIIFSIRRFSPNNPLDKQSLLADIYRFNRATNELNKLTISNNFGHFSSNGKQIYYSDEQSNIFEYDNEHIRGLDTKGWGVSISPDATKLAYVLRGSFYDSVYMYDLINSEAKKLFTSRWFYGIRPIIRWSKDSQLIALASESEFSLGSIFIVNVSSKEVLFEYEKNYACNWFFTEEGQ